MGWRALVLVAVAVVDVLALSKLLIVVVPVLVALLKEGDHLWRGALGWMHERRRAGLERFGEGARRVPRRPDRGDGVGGSHGRHGDHGRAP